MNLKDLMKKNKKQDKKKTAKNLAVGAGIGTALGVAAGILLAPKSGKETREAIAKNAREALDTVKETVEDAKNKLSSIRDDKKASCGSEEAAAAAECTCNCEEDKEEDK